MADIALACGRSGSPIGRDWLTFGWSGRPVSPLVELTGKVNRGEAPRRMHLPGSDD